MAGGSDVATGVTLVGATSGWTCEITDFNWTGVTRGSNDKTHHGSTQPANDGSEVGGDEFEPDVLGDPGQWELEINHDPNNPPPLFKVAETWTLTFKKKTGDGSAATVAATGFITDYDVSNPVKGMRKANVTLKLSGVVALTDAA